MRSRLPACWLLLLTLTAPVRCNDVAEIEVTDTADGIKLSCSDKYELEGVKGESVKSLEYKDENTGEYTCMLRTKDADPVEGSKIYVKFRTCDNCIELDVASITGIVVGDVVATIVIGVAVYLIASQTRVAPVTSHKKRTDRQHLIRNDVSREPNDHYQPLNPRVKDTYDVLNRK